MKLRSFNADGINRFEQFLSSAVRDTEDLHSFLVSPGLSIAVSPEIEVEARSFVNRFAAGEYLYSLFGDSSIFNLDEDRGIWAWLSAFYFDQLCPDGTKLGKDYRWIPVVNSFRNYYRHLLAGPYFIYRAHKDHPQHAMAVLVAPLHRPGDIVEQLASRQELVTNKSVMEAATRLYIGEDGAPKPRAAGRGAGSARRLADVLTQLDLTWDLYDLSTEKLLELLPAEFDEFKA